MNICFQSYFFEPIIFSQKSQQSIFPPGEGRFLVCWATPSFTCGRMLASVHDDGCCETQTCHNWSKYWAALALHHKYTERQTYITVKSSFPNGDCSLRSIHVEHRPQNLGGEDQEVSRQVEEKKKSPIFYPIFTSLFSIPDSSGGELFKQMVQAK